MPYTLPNNDITLLYVEDDQLTRDQVSRMLGGVVTTLLVAGNGREGLELFAAHGPDIVITDISMPVMNGLDMVREIKAIVPDCQVIVLTAFCDTEYLLECISLGINQYSQKPLDFSKLVKSIEQCKEYIFLKRRLKKQDDSIRMLSQAMDQAPAPVVITALDGTIEYVNAMFTRVTGYEAAEVIGKNPKILKSDLNRPEIYRDLWQTITAGNEWESELANRRKNGQIYWEWVRICPMRDSRGDVIKYLKVAQDITERKSYEENLHFLSTHDPLTGLYNRSYFDSVLKRLATSPDYPVSIVIADIDGLKLVNDSSGHGEGDQLIRRSAELLMKVFRASDVVSRIGGDEFGIILPHTDEQTAQATVERIRNSCPIPAENANGYNHVLSVGTATACEPSGLQRSLKLADERMYQDKAERRQRRNALNAGASHDGY